MTSEAQERQAALARGRTAGAERPASQPAATLLRFGPQRLFSALADNVRDYAVFLLDADGIIRHWGEGARLMKWWSRAEAEGSHLRMLYPEGGAEDGSAEAHLATAASHGEYIGEGRRVRSDESTFWAGVTLTALRNEQNDLLGFVKVTRDFTARRAAEAALREGQNAVEGQRLAEEAMRLKSLFVASVSHEIRGPLNTLLGSAQLLARDGGTAGRREAHIRRIEGTAAHLLALTSDLLDHARMEAGRLSVTSSTVKVGDVVGQALADAETQASSRVVRLNDSVSASAAELSFWGDAIRVRQIVVNLLSNAIKYTPSAGVVTVSAGSAVSAPGEHLAGLGPWVYVRVEDNGEGIPSDRLSAIFEPFEQATPAHATRGSGLGLTISRRLARLMGGELTVQSDVGRGSAFIVWLPVAATGRVPR